MSGDNDESERDGGRRGDGEGRRGRVGVKSKAEMCLLDALRLSHQESQVLTLKINFLNSHRGQHSSHHFAVILH